jgi:hypothetical protein
MKYSAIDLHSNNSLVTGLDEADRVVAEKRRPNELSTILAFLSPRRLRARGGRGSICRAQQTHAPDFALLLSERTERHCDRIHAKYDDQFTAIAHLPPPWRLYAKSRAGQ